MAPMAIGRGAEKKAAYAAFFDSPLLLEQRERKEGCPDERQRSMDGEV